MTLPVRATTAAAAALSTLALSAPPGRPLAATTARATCSPDTGPVGIRVSPPRGPVGTRVHLTGRCFLRHWDAGYGIFLSREFTKPRECEVIAGGTFRFGVDRSRVGRGWFTVASDGACFQHDYRRRVTPGVYQLSVGCHACAVARFRVTQRKRGKNVALCALDAPLVRGTARFARFEEHDKSR